MKYRYTREELVICLEEANHDWPVDQYEEVIRRYNEGEGIPQLARSFKRSKLEIGIAIMDADTKGKVNSKWGALGKKH